MSKIKLVIAPPNDKRFKETFFLVEATSFERQCLWEKWNKKLNWKDQGMGCVGQIGTLAKLPVVICFFWAHIDGRQIAFWESTSRVTDSEMAKKWLEENCIPPKWDGGTRNSRCDAANFHLCIHAIQEANQRELLPVAS